MNTKRIAATVAAVLCGLVGILAQSPAANASPNPVHHDFTRANPSWGYAYNISNFNGQVDYGTDSFQWSLKDSFQWSLKLNPSVQRIVLAPMSCFTTINGVPGYSDSHTGIPADYLLHSSVRVPRGVTLQLRSRCDFKVLTDTGPTPSNVETAVDFTVS
ncbi:hypothetical protein [Nocardia vaccinii]|uniref:hypothetical protein n=1 Tax=Nocardia vaccinii TaxID=1822 RepID=UPI000AB26EBC|nr:hypothetical protein [Nocardia vaccinii]